MLVGLKTINNVKYMIKKSLMKMAKLLKEELFQRRLEMSKEKSSPDFEKENLLKVLEKLKVG